MKLLISALLFALSLGGVAFAQNAGQRVFDIDVTGGKIEPITFAAPGFQTGPGAETLARDILVVVTDNLRRSGLFREIPRAAHIATSVDFNTPPDYSDWSGINAQALIVGAADMLEDGRLQVKFRLFDVFAQTTVGEGLKFAGAPAQYRRMAHKISDAIYSRLTGEDGYFDSRVVFVSENGPKNARKKQISIMDQDGAGLRRLTDDAAIVLAPRFGPAGKEIIYTSYETGKPAVFKLDVDSLAREKLVDLQGMAFAPRYSPDGRTVVLSLSEAGNTDIYAIDVATGRKTRLTAEASIETAPSFSPDGSQIVFESDRGGSQQIYVMSASGGPATRISFGQGRYATPVWSPRGDLIAFTKMNAGRFHIGVMRTDGSRERLLTASFLDEAPTWSPNGRVLMFFRESAGENGAPQLFSVDISGRNLQKRNTPEFASDPSWSKLLK